MTDRANRRAAPIARLSRITLLVIASALLIAGHWLPGLDGTPIDFGIRDALHVVVFAGFALIVVGLFSRLSATRAVIVTLLVSALVAVASEYLQFVRGSSANTADIFRDLIGAALILVAWLLWRRAKANNGNSWKRRLALLTVALVFAPLVFWLIIASLNYLASPSLISFDHWWERLAVWEVRARFEQQDGLESSGNAGRFALSPDNRTGISIFPSANDWSDYQYLVFMAQMAEGPDASLSIRINDGDRFRHYSGSFTHEVPVTSEPTRIRLPLADLIADPNQEAMDLSDIRQLTMLAPRRPVGTLMVLDDIRLE